MTAIGLAPETIASLEALAATLSPGQTLQAARWLLGRFDESALAASRLELSAQPGAAQAREGVTVLYGTHSGHSASIAKQLASKIKARGWSVVVTNMADYSKNSLKRETHLAIVVSTHGEGQPPESAEPFFSYVLGGRAPKLEGCKFAVLALGDASYVKYCQAGADLDARLEALGAQRLIERMDAGVDYQETAEAWIDRVVDAFTPTLHHAEVSSPIVSAPVSQRIGRENPWPAEVTERIILSGKRSTQCYAHIEMSLEGAALSYEPGDALGVQPRNRPELVRQIIELLGASADQAVQLSDTTLSLAEALSTRLELAQVSASGLRKYAKFGSDTLSELVQNSDATQAYLRGRDWQDVLQEHPLSINCHDFVAILPELASRSYSIASSLLAHPEEVHLLVSRVTYTTYGRQRSGVASGYLADQVQVGQRVPVWVEPNTHFRLPEDSSIPIVMIGAGTGIAPFRAFLEARAATGATGKNWVVFGNRNFRSDFTYQVEWLKWRDQGVLTRMDIAFSRDRGPKRYVTDELRERGKELYAWLEEGARIYVCGDRAKLSTSVDQVLIDAFVTHGGQSIDRAAQTLSELTAHHRYLKDVY